jgi:aspartyl aminopeptidase
MLGVVLAGCVARAPALEAPAGEAAPAPAADEAAAGAAPARAEGAANGPARGWKAVDAAAHPRIHALADDYAAFLATAKTPRRAVAGLRAAFGEAAALDAGVAATPGARYLLVGPGGDAAAFVVVGKRPVEEGVRIVVAAVDAPRLDLEPRPVFDHDAGFTMLDTVPYGDLDLAAWLARPLALYLYVSRPGAALGDLDLAIGEDDDDPVLIVPDLLPHLSRKAQRPDVVDSPERMNAIATRSRRALTAVLAGRGLDERDFAAAEAYLVPAGPPHRIGVDRALLAGYGHGHRALAYAAVRALGDAGAPHHTAVVIAVSKAQIGGTGASGRAFVRTALSRVIEALAEGGAELDVLDVRRIFGRSAMIIAEGYGGEPGHGLVLNPRGDDALPAAHRRVIDRLRGAGAQVQLVAEQNWWSPARALGTLDIDAVDVGLPIAGRGAPLELLSILDLYQAYLGSGGWLTAP